MEEYNNKNMEDIIRQKESIKETDIGAKYDEYKKTDEYKEYFCTIQNDKPNMNAYLIDLCIFGYFYETLLEEMDPEERSKYVSIVEQEETEKNAPLKVPELLKCEVKAIDVFDSYEDYLKANPHVKDMPTIGEPLTLL